MTKPVPEGYHTVTASFTFKNSQKAIEFYGKAFNAKVLEMFPRPGGGTMHATMRIGDTIAMMGDEWPGREDCKSAESTGNSPISFYLYVPDVDKVFRQALNAGAKETMPLADMFWGDRCGTVKDPFGYSWTIATRVRDLTKKQVEEGAEAFFAHMSKA